MSDPRATIVRYNNQAQVFCAPDHLQVLRKVVAVQEQELPPNDVQGMVKGYFKKRSPHAPLLWQSPSLTSRLEALGWGPERLTTKMIKAVIHNKGMWDGWSSLVTSHGVMGPGLVDFACRVLHLHLGIPKNEIVIRDARAVPDVGRQLGTRPSLFPFQDDAVGAFLARGQGVIDLPPRSGKTHVAITVVKELGLPALVVVPTKALVEQTVLRFREHFPADQVVGVTGGKINAAKQRDMVRALVWVSTPQTAAGSRTREEIEAQLARRGMFGIQSRVVLVTDEAHHNAADTLIGISNAAVNAYYRLGLTGTYYRNDRKDLKMHSICGSTLYQRSVGDMVALGRLVPAEVAMVRVPGYCESDPQWLYRNGIVHYAPRNQLIVWAAQHLMARGFRVLMITKEVEHSEVLAAAIGQGAAQVDGRTSDELQTYLQALASGSIKCLVGTSVIGEGVDVPAADALVYVAGTRARSKQVQDYFRVLTANAGKRFGIIIDFADLHADRLCETSAYRLSRYRAERAFNSSVMDAAALPGWLDARSGAVPV